MANNYTNLNDLFTAMADVIRTKKNSTEEIIADNFPVEIENLKSGFDYNNHEVTAIPDYAFYGCEDLKSVDCGNLTNIGVSAFENCKNLESVILWDNVVSVGENAFKGCDRATIYCMFDSQPETWHENWNPDGCEVVLCGDIVETWNISKTENDDVTARLCSNGYMFVNGVGDMSDFIYVPELDGDITDIPWYSRESQIIHIIMSDNITSIGTYAFYYCNSLESIVFSNSITSIGGSAFYGCNSLTSITIPNSITSIGGRAFRRCRKLTTVNISESVTVIGREVFDGCVSLTSVVIPDGVTTINYGAFNGCSNLTYITIPNSVTIIDTWAFHNCNILSITYTGTVAQWKSIKQNTDAFYLIYAIYCADGTIATDGTITYYNT